MAIRVPEVDDSVFESGTKEKDVRNPSPYVFGPDGVIVSTLHVPGMSLYWQPPPTGFGGTRVSQPNRIGMAKRHAKI
jgi:hypothetical protein